MTRHRIEHQLGAVRRVVTTRGWTPYVVLAGALVAGVVASRIPLLKLIQTGARTVETGVAVASTVAMVRRFVAERRDQKAA